MAFPWLAAAMVGSSALNLLGGSKSKGQSGVTGPSVVTLPQYSFTEPRLKLTSDFIAGNLQNLSEGKYPTYYQNALPTLREGMARPLRETYFGSEGLRGKSVLDQVRATGAALGTGPKATVARENQALVEYASAEKQIDEYLTKLGVDIASQDSRYFTQASIQMPQGPSTVVVPGQGYNVPQKPDYMGQFLQTAGAALPYLMNQPTSQPTLPGGGGMDYYGTGVSTEYGAWTPSAPPSGYNYNWQPPVYSNQYSSSAPSSASAYDGRNMTAWRY